MTTEEIKIKGMTCEHCIRAVAQELDKLPLNVEKVSMGTAKVSYDPERISRKRIEAAIIEAGYHVDDNGNGSTSSTKSATASTTGN